MSAPRSGKLPCPKMHRIRQAATKSNTVFQPRFSTPLHLFLVNLVLLSNYKIICSTSLPLAPEIKRTCGSEVRELKRRRRFSALDWNSGRRRWGYESTTLYQLELQRMKITNHPDHLQG